MRVIHKTMTLKDRKSKGYEGYLERSACNHRVYTAWCMPVSWLRRNWSEVTCKQCLKSKGA